MGDLQISGNQQHGYSVDFIMADDGKGLTPEGFLKVFAVCVMSHVLFVSF